MFKNGWKFPNQKIKRGQLLKKNKTVKHAINKEKIKLRERF